jgi:serine/threonine-protein kinase
VSIRRTLGVNYYYARRWDQASYHLLRAIAMDPSAEETYRMLGLVQALDGRQEEAERSLREALAMPTASLLTEATLGYVLGRAGRPEEAAAREASLRRRAETDYVSPVAFAMLALGRGDHEAALDWAERAHAERRGWLAYLDVNPVLDPLRGHPRFEALRRQLRLGSG